MADELDVLLEKVADPGLRAELRAAVDKVRAKRSFGLVFEAHLPERVRLPEYPVRRGTKVVRRADKNSGPMKVEGVRRGQATVVTDDGTRDTVPVDDLVVVAEFGEPVYPGLTSVGSIQRGGDKPAHVVINAENHHALEMLQFTHAGKVDCVYIDPPYNTGARDWKYDNNYVDGDDAYRHSKWLAFMERRLLLSKELLNPDDSVLIVTIDEKEFLRLGLLLQQTFPGKDVQQVTIVTNRAGSPRPDRFTRVEEYAFFVFLGESSAANWTSNLLVENDVGSEVPTATFWFSAVRVGSRKALRSYYTETTLFYPVLIRSDNGELHSVGPPLRSGEALAEYRAPEGTQAIWPVSNGREQTWRFTREKMVEYLANGTARLGRRDLTTGLRPVTYLRPGTVAAIEAGRVRVTGRTVEGALELASDPSSIQTKPPASVWNQTSHYARDHGSKLLARFVPGSEFPFPKSLYAEEDAIRIAVGNKPEAVVVDFFAGSGTTAHAVMRLNRQDGGRRQAIVVTNNEVSADEAKSLTMRGLRDGDPEWEAWGIFEKVTRPRITAAVTGRTPGGTLVKGDYKFTDEFPMAEGFEENVEFMKLTYLDPVDVELDRAFEAVAPMLWLRAGGQGSMVAERAGANGDLLPFAVADRYGVLFDPDRGATSSQRCPPMRGPCSW